MLLDRTMVVFESSSVFKYLLQFSLLKKYEDATNADEMWMDGWMDGAR